MQNILIIDDDERLGKLLTQYFKQFELGLHQALRPSDGLKLLDTNSYDLLILDVMLPEMDGFETCKHIRKTSNIPILMLTARGEVTDRIVGMEIGADDYLPKPFEPRELVVRIQSILKRSKHHSPSSNVLNFGDLVIDTDMRSVSINNNDIPLSSMEYNLLAILSSQPNKVFGRDEILNSLKGIDADIYSRAIDIQISRLRQKLKPCNYIKTIRGAGYTFSAKIVS